MRLIDADELLTAFPVDDEPTLTKSCVRMTIKNMPAIEPERKKGKWIELEPKGVWTSVYHCSECGGAVMSCRVDLPKYCGHCGARMEGLDETD